MIYFSRIKDQIVIHKRFLNSVLKLYFRPINAQIIKFNDNKCAHRMHNLSEDLFIL
jgi:hypothetical protein